MLRQSIEQSRVVGPLGQIGIIVCPAQHRVLDHELDIDHATRAAHIAGVTPNPDSAFMAQVARNLTDYVDGFLRDHRFLILDRDSKFTKQFKYTLKSAGVNVILKGL